MLGRWAGNVVTDVCWRGNVMERLRGRKGEEKHCIYGQVLWGEERVLGVSVACVRRNMMVRLQKEENKVLEVGKGCGDFAN